MRFSYPISGWSCFSLSPCIHISLFNSLSGTVSITLPSDTSLYLSRSLLRLAACALPLQRQFLSIDAVCIVSVFLARLISKSAYRIRSKAIAFAAHMRPEPATRRRCVVRVRLCLVDENQKRTERASQSISQSFRKCIASSALRHHLQFNLFLILMHSVWPQRSKANHTHTHTQRAVSSQTWAAINVLGASLSADSPTRKALVWLRRRAFPFFRLIQIHQSMAWDQIE